jgi:hypothetical protein
MASTILYDGRGRCHTKDCCPLVVETDDGKVRIHDPAKPESGSFLMLREEWDAMRNSFKK